MPVRALRGPLVLRCFVALETSVPQQASTTSVALLVAAGLTAASAGAALAGWLIDAVNPAAPLILAMAVLLCATLATWTPSKPAGG